MASLIGQLFGGQASAPDMGNVNALIQQRQGQISDFANQLASARTAYMSQLQNYSQNVYNMFGKNLAAQFGAAGGTPGSGAFSSGLGREAAQLYGNLATTGYQTNAQGLEAVNNAYAGAYAPAMSALTQGDLAQYQTQQGRIGQLGQGIGSLVGTGVNAGLSYATGNYGLNNAMTMAAMNLRNNPGMQSPFSYGMPGGRVGPNQNPSAYAGLQK